MSGKTIKRVLNKAATHFKRKLIENEFPVIPPPPVPDHIVKPQYALNPRNPEFALYEGAPAVLNQTEIQSRSPFIQKSKSLQELLPTLS